MNTQKTDTTAPVVAQAHPAVGPGPALHLVVEPRRVLTLGMAVITVLAAVNLAARLVAGRTQPDDLSGILFHVVPLTDLDAESNIPSWYSAVLLATCAMALWTLAHETRVRADRWSRHWRLLALGFVYLSVDESARLHERIGQRVRDALDLDGALYFSWVVVAVPAIVVVALVFLRLLRSLPRRTALAFVVSGATYLVGAVGMEMIGATLVDGSGYGTAPYIVISTIEEVLEMVGVTLFLAAVADHRRRHVVSDVVAP